MSNNSTINGVLLTPLKVINVQEGNILHGMKCSDAGYSGFGEAYFSMIKSGAIKAWKRHNLMSLNLVVPLGAIRFVLFDDRQNSRSNGLFQQVTLSTKNYYRLTVPPLVWMGFQGVYEDTSMLLNIADIEHVPEEADRKEMSEINFDWELSN